MPDSNIPYIVLFYSTSAGEDYVMESFTLVFSATVRGPICTNITILNDDIYESKESLTFNLSTIDTSVILNPAGGVMSIYDEDGEIFLDCGSQYVWDDYLCV